MGRASGRASLLVPRGRALGEAPTATTVAPPSREIRSPNCAVAEGRSSQNAVP